MRLDRDFTRLPLSCDTARLAEELAAVEPHEWRAHPTGFAGNSAALLVTVGGGQNDDFAHAGQLAPTPLLERLPYVRTVMRRLASPISRSRFMRLAPGQQVPQHDDVGWHWFDRIRVHVPVVTDPAVRFHCADRSVHMAAGEIWIFDNFIRHAVVNDSAITRVHLVIDILPTADFFALVARGDDGRGDPPGTYELIAPDGGGDAPVLIERFARRAPAAERLRALAADIERDLGRLRISAIGRARTRQALRALVEGGDDFETFRAAARRLVRALGPAYLRRGGDDPQAAFGFLGGMSVGKSRGADAIRVLAEVEQRTIAHAEMGLREIVGALGPAHGTYWALRKAMRDRSARG